MTLLFEVFVLIDKEHPGIWLQRSKRSLWYILDLTVKRPVPISPEALLRSSQSTLPVSPRMRGTTAEDSPAVRLSRRMKCGRGTAGNLSDSPTQPERNYKTNPACPSAAQPQAKTNQWALFLSWSHMLKFNEVESRDAATPLKLLVNYWWGGVGRGGVVCNPSYAIWKIRNHHLYHIQSQYIYQ